MSRLSQIAMELDEQARELGYDNYLDAVEFGGYNAYFNGTTYVLIKAGTDEQDMAHQAWLKERAEVLGELNSVYNDIDVPKDLKKYIKHAIEFIKKGEM